MSDPEPDEFLGSFDRASGIVAGGFGLLMIALVAFLAGQWLHLSEENVISELGPWLACVAIGLYCAAQTYFDFRRKRFVMAALGGIAALIVLGYAALLIPMLLRWPSY